jgi:hypothetical protein
MDTPRIREKKKKLALIAKPWQVIGEDDEQAAEKGYTPWATL